MTVTTLAPIKRKVQYLTDSDRSIISQIINVAVDEIVTIWIDCGTVWVKLVNGRLPFERNWFAARVAEVKETIKPVLTAAERNEINENELIEACKGQGIQIIKPDYFMGFSATLIKNGICLGRVGFNEYGVIWCSRGRNNFNKIIVKSAKGAINQLQSATLIQA